MAATLSQNVSGQKHERPHHHHDRMQDEGAELLPLTPPTISGSSVGGGDAPEITVVQRMLSATTGSFVTSLLVTPLDVVRVRWQSQSVSHPAIDFEKLPANFQKILSGASSGTAAAFRPTDLGVTACCREVFFTSANAEVCMAGATISAPEAAAAAAAVDCAVQQRQQKTFHSTMDGLRKIAHNEGVFTLWRGLSPTLVMSVPANIIYFTGYEWLRYNPRSPIGRLTGSSDTYAPLLAGATARVLAAAAVGPIELFRTRLQASPGAAAASSSGAASHVRQTFHGLQTMVQQHGYRSLWRGLTLTLWRDVPFSGMYWWGYEAVRGRLADLREQRRGRTAALDLAAAAGTSTTPGHAQTPQQQQQQQRDLDRRRRRSQSRDNQNHADTFIESFTAGALSGAAASVATMPFDVGKTRTQVFRDTQMGSGGGASAAAGAAAATPEESNMARLLWHIFKTEGVAGLFKGWIPRTLKVAPACAIMISSYEVGKKVFRGVNERAQLRQLENGRRL